MGCAAEAAKAGVRLCFVENACRAATVYNMTRVLKIIGIIGGHGVKRPDVISDKGTMPRFRRARPGLPSRVEIGKKCSKTLTEDNASQPRPVKDPQPRYHAT